MNFFIKIKNITDVITNSSSEVFLVKTDELSDTEKVKREIISYHNVHNWVHDDFQKLPEEVKAVIGGDKTIDTIKEMLNGMSGEGGDIKVYTWKDAYYGYCNCYNKKYTVEQWTKINNISLDEIKYYILVDVDWNANATINKLKNEYNIIYNDEYNNTNDKLCELFYYAKFY